MRLLEIKIGVVVKIMVLLRGFSRGMAIELLLVLNKLKHSGQRFLAHLPVKAVRLAYCVKVGC